MSKEVTVEELIANIADYVAEMKNGETLIVMEGGRQVATVTPAVGKPGMRYPFRDLKFSPRPKNLRSNSTDLIREDRDAEIKKHGF